VSGDTVTVSAIGVEVNSALLQHTVAADRDSPGRTMDRVANGKYVVRENELWLLSTHHPLSFDSRYFGPIGMTDVLARVRPLWQ
jgi:type IV secretory pathway protease TraF